MIPENTDLDLYRCPYCHGQLKRWWNIPDEGVVCIGKCEGKACTVFYDLGELEKAEG